MLGRKKEELLGVVLARNSRADTRRAISLAGRW